MERIKLLKLVHKVDENKLHSWLARELQGLLNYTITDTPDFIFAEPKGDEFIPVVLVAHLDTVHQKSKSKFYAPSEPTIYYDADQRVLWSPDGLGADDRAGVFAALELVRKFNVAVLFTHGEESGGTGAKAFTTAYPDRTKDYKMMIQLDRRGRRDAVFYSNNSTDFHDYIVEAGFVKAFGSFSDISIIAPKWRINSVNLSVGYEDEHTKTEHLFVDHLLETISKVSNLLDQPILEFKYEAWSYGYNSYNKGSYYLWDRETNKYKEVKCTDTEYYPITGECNHGNSWDVCYCCGEAVDWDADFETVYESEDDRIGHVCCRDCYDSLGGYECVDCMTTAFESLVEYPQAIDLKLCEDCYYDIVLAGAGKKKVDKKNKKK